jgi:hypothetical protein
MSFFTNEIKKNKETKREIIALGLALIGEVVGEVMAQLACEP